MFLPLTHTNFDVYKTSRELLIECYKAVNYLPRDERFNLGLQIKRAALSVKLNIAEGASRKSIIERKRFYEIARGSVVEIDSAIDACIHLNFITEDKLQVIGSLLNRCFSMLSKMTGKVNK